MGGMKVGIRKPKHGQPEASGEVLAVADDDELPATNPRPASANLARSQTFRLAKPFITITSQTGPGQISRHTRTHLWTATSRPLYLQPFV
jgi:hypothetical protein